MKHVTRMTIYDAEHYSDEEREAIIASYPAHEREARAKGIPQLGSGRIFPISDEAISVDPFPIPRHWPRIAGLDFGWDHPTAAAWLAWDRDTDTIYVTDCYKQKEQPIPVHASAIKARGAWIPVGWPHDGLQHDKGSGMEMRRQYAEEGVNMLFEHATYEDGGTGVEAGLMDMLTRMQNSTFKVFRHLSEWFEEFRLYHRKDGRVIKEFDDLMAATRYGIMMIRHSATEPEKESVAYTVPSMQRHWD